MAARHQPSVTGLDPADAPDQLVGLIEELRVEITTHETCLVKIAFSGTPHVGSALRREVRDIPGQTLRRVWNEGRSHYETPDISGDAVWDDRRTIRGRNAHPEPFQRRVTPNDAGLPSLLVAVR